MCLCLEVNKRIGYKFNAVVNYGERARVARVSDSARVTPISTKTQQLNNIQYKVADGSC